MERNIGGERVDEMTLIATECTEEQKRKKR